MSTRPRLLVVGSPSLDLLHFGGRSVRSAGGAGLYTALAAQRVGADVTVVAPRPDPMPAELAPADRLLDWRGPPVPPSALPHFEIEYFADGRTVYRQAVRGSEGDIRYSDIPDAGPGAFAYVVPLLDPELQLGFARRLAAAGVRVGCGTYAPGIRQHQEVVARVVEASHYFFCNEEEAELLFGSLDDVAVAPGRVVFVTRGRLGARVVMGDHPIDVPAPEVEQVDPTGAGDTFCGTALARLAAGDHPAIAARVAAVRAAQTVTGIGPATLLSDVPPPVAPRDVRVRVDRGRIRRVAEVIASAPEAAAFDFTGPDFPEPGDPVALDFFFAATVQQFGFWRERAGRYEEPMIASLGGRALKGSDYLWAAYRRWAREAPDELTPGGHAALDDADFDHRLRDDGGHNPLPAGTHHPACARAYGHSMLGLGLTPASLLAEADAANRPLAHFLARLDAIGGYREDPWRKKSALLAAILSQRPERFLRLGAGEDVPPIVDYHCQRSCLRLGVVSVPDETLAAKLAKREVVSAEEEEAVRAACYEAVGEIRRLSGRSMGAVDWFFFQNRTRCPEMTEPDCAACPADGACAHRTRLFQPVFRTTAY
ncbi:carbohydrate kinase family protein [Candidatus Palauibacter soopunensis]|uniref:carbohydrate kinase family protein n=1 Tax=Candidatus Palauibacter soopunensis TaxID=3056739 RepID=UPI00239702E3|nr:carbohydrate kinase family protein [Candidatus Palauibacter soopunensis]MDE2877768.1 carbohydrate kinase family protein [Candidatus Palauibacter soopunensis]